jgi:TolB-like protein/Tfp pilus assembly protein PilF
MPENDNNPLSFFQELKRRKVIRVIIVYAAAAFAILELVSIIAEPFGLPDWTIKFVFVILCIGLIITIILSWIYDITPEGIEKTKSAKETAGEIPARQSGVNAWRIAIFISIIIIVGFILLQIAGDRKQVIDLTELEKSIAVLPLNNWSQNDEYSYLGDAIADEIIMQLKNINEFRVLSLTSTLQYKDNPKPTPLIAEELGVNYILEGGIQRHNDNVSIRVQFIRTKHEDHIWGEEYNGKWEDIFSFQDEIAIQIAEELKIVLSPRELALIEKEPTRNHEAYEYYLRGNDYYHRSYDQQDYSIAIKMYQKAIELDPDFALAYTRLALTHLDLYWIYYDWSKERLIKSKQAIDAAQMIDPALNEINIALGVYYYYGFLDYSQALDHFQIALKQTPKNSECLYWIACVNRRAGNWEKAIETFEKASELDPRSYKIIFELASTYDLLREYPTGLHYYETTMLLRPDWYLPYYYNAFAHVKRNGDTQKARSVLKEANYMISSAVKETYMNHAIILLELYDGNYEEALKYLTAEKSEAFQDDSRFIPRHLYFAMIYGLKNNPDMEHAYYDSSRIMLENRILRTPDDSRLYSSLGIAYAGLGRKKEAIEAGEKAVELLPISKEAWSGTDRMEDLARIYVMTREYEKAVERIELLLSIPGMLSSNLLQLDPVWKPLWDHPDFIRLIEKYS